MLYKIIILIFEKFLINSTEIQGNKLVAALKLFTYSYGF